MSHADTQALLHINETLDGLRTEMVEVRLALFDIAQAIRDIHKSYVETSRGNIPIIGDNT